MDEPDDDARRRASLVGLGVAAAVVLLAVLALWLIRDNLKTERCLEERRHNCSDTVQAP